MRILLFTLLFLFLSFHAPARAVDALYHRQVNQKNPGGKNLVITVNELRRDEKTSTIKVKCDSGAALMSSMIILNAFYDIARVREASYFIKLKEWENQDGAWMYVVGFTRDKKTNPLQYFAIKKPLPDDEAFEFLAVKEFDIAFKNKQWSSTDLDRPFQGK